MKLNADIISGKGFLYAKEGEIVKIISDRNPAMIVENEKGFKFSVHFSKLVDEITVAPLKEASVLKEPLELPTPIKNKNSIIQPKLF